MVEVEYDLPVAGSVQVQVTVVDVKPLAVEKFCDSTTPEPCDAFDTVTSTLLPFSKSILMWFMLPLAVSVNLLIISIYTQPDLTCQQECTCLVLCRAKRNVTLLDRSFGLGLRAKEMAALYIKHLLGTDGNMLEDLNLTGAMPKAANSGTYT